ncbi:MAG: four helix bundle protein [Bacteroidales bacterium]|nr:four helix bundle protein [Bacteroidales bacterium]
MNKKNLIQEKSLALGVRIINFYKYLCKEKHEYILAKQILRCGTSIGANICESRNAQSVADFISKLSIALKEADETQYWLELLWGANVISEQQFTTLDGDVRELIALLTSILKTLKKKK